MSPYIAYMDPMGNYIYITSIQHHSVVSMSGLGKPIQCDVPNQFACLTAPQLQPCPTVGFYGAKTMRIAVTSLLDGVDFSWMGGWVLEYWIFRQTQTLLWPCPRQFPWWLVWRENIPKTKRVTFLVELLQFARMWWAFIEFGWVRCGQSGVV
jgi:hypothetical protein